MLSFKPSCLSQLLQLLWSHVWPSDRRWPTWVPNPVEGRLGRWEHVKVGAFHTLLSELPLRTEFYFLCACKQLFTLALLSYGHSIQMMKHICCICHRIVQLLETRTSRCIKAACLWFLRQLTTRCHLLARTKTHYFYGTDVRKWIFRPVTGSGIGYLLMA